jgi:hypothetical protein
MLVTVMLMATLTIYLRHLCRYHAFDRLQLEFDTVQLYPNLINDK